MKGHDAPGTTRLLGTSREMIEPHNYHYNDMHKTRTDSTAQTDTQTHVGSVHIYRENIGRIFLEPSVISPVSPDGSGDVDSHSLCPVVIYIKVYVQDGTRSPSHSLNYATCTVKAYTGLLHKTANRHYRPFYYPLQISQSCGSATHLKKEKKKYS